MNLFWTIVVILALIWAIGYLLYLPIIGPIIHIVLAVAIIIVAYRLLTGKDPFE